MASPRKKIKLIEMLEKKEYNDLMHLCLNQDKEMSQLKHSNNNLVEILKSIDPAHVDSFKTQIKVDEKVISHKFVQTDEISYCELCAGTRPENYKDIIYGLYNERESADLNYTPMVHVASQLAELQKDSLLCPSSWLVAFIKFIIYNAGEQKRHVEYAFFDFPKQKSNNRSNYTLWGSQRKDNYSSSLNYKSNTGVFVNNILHDISTVEFPVSMTGGIPDLELLIHYTILSFSVSNGTQSYERFCENETSISKDVVAKHMLKVIDNLTQSIKANEWDGVTLKSINGFSAVFSSVDLASDEYTILIENLKNKARVNSYVYERSPLMVCFKNDKFNKDDGRVEETKSEFSLYYYLVRSALILSAIKMLSNASYARDEQFFQMVIENGSNVFTDGHIYAAKEVGVTFYHSFGSMFPGFFMLVNLMPKLINKENMSVFETSEDPLYSFYNNRDSTYVSDLEHRASFVKLFLHYCKLYHKFNGKIPSTQPPKELNNFKEKYNLNLFKFLYKSIDKNWFCPKAVSKMILYMKDCYTRKTNYCELSKSTKLLYGLPNNEKSLSCDNFAFFNNPVLFTVTDK